MNDRIQWIHYKGKRILFIDISNMREEDQCVRLLEEVEAEVLKQPKGEKVLTIFNAPNALVSTKVTERGKQITENAKAIGIPSGEIVIIGTTGFQKAVISALQVVRKEIHVADTIEEAKEWLSKQ